MQSMDTSSIIALVAVMVLPMVFAITVHEAAHAWVADKLGDKTARMLGRISLNPLRHIDPLGTILVPILAFLFIGFPFGWAKPVPVNWRNFKNPRKDMGIVAFAGPMSNLLMAVIWSLVAKVGVLIHPFSQWVGGPLTFMGEIGVFFNVALMVLNLVPIPPLDGSRVVNIFLSPRHSVAYLRLEPYGVFIVIALLATRLPEAVLSPIIDFIVGILPTAG